MSWAEVKNLKDKMSDIANSTLHIEGGTDLAGQEVIIKRYDSDYMKATLDSTGSLEVEVTPKSKYRVTSNDADLSKRSQDIEVGTGDLVNVELSYRKYIGKDVLPVDDVPTWLACHPTAGSYKYTTMEQVLKDSACLIALLSNQNSLDYLMRSAELFTALVDNAAACAQFASMNICNDALCGTPVMIPIATKSPNCGKIFQWKLSRVVSAINTNSCEMEGNLRATKLNGYNEQLSIVNALNCPEYVPVRSGSWDTINTGSYNNIEGAFMTITIPTGKLPVYKYVPKCIIFNAPVKVTSYTTGAVASVSAHRYGTDDVWDTLGSVKFGNEGERVYVDIADNDREYYEFKVEISSTTNAWNGVGNFKCIGGLNILGYRFAYKDGREYA